MSSRTDRLGTFRQALAAHEVECRTVGPVDVADAVGDLLQPPAVGVPLDRDDCTLPDAVDVEPTPATLDAAVTGVTGAEAGVAAYGSIFLGADAAGTEPVSLFPERHVVVLDADDVVADLRALFDDLGPRFRAHAASGVLATGPSATADMGDLVLGAHGPAEVAVVLVDGDIEEVDGNDLEINGEGGGCDPVGGGDADDGGASP